MNIFFRELRANLKSLVIWCVVLILLVVVGAAKFTAYYNNPSMLAVLDILPKAMVESMELSAFNLTTVTGFYGLMMIYYALMGGIAAAMWASDSISKEERDKTVEFSLVLPVSRDRVVTGKLLEGCLDGLVRHDVKDDDIDVVWSPGAFEIPVLAQQLAATKRYAAVICLGAVIRGGTDHYQYVASEVAKGVAMASMSTSVPVIFGVLTTDTIEQAIERAGTKAGNKGWDVAMTAIEMIDLLKQI